jgi:hypothetical protein
MTPDPRLQDLLERYPFDLSDDELTELRSAAEADPELEDLLDALLEVDDGLSGGTPRPELSQVGERRLERLALQIADEITEPASPHDLDANDADLSLAPGGPGLTVVRGEGPPGDAQSWSTGGATTGGGLAGKASREDGDGASSSRGSPGDAQSWSTGGATTGGGLKGQVVDLGEARRRRMSPQGLWLIAAGLLVGLAFVAGEFMRPSATPTIGPDIGIKGGEEQLSGRLFLKEAVEGGFVAVEDGQRRALSASVRLQVSMNTAAHLALVETRDGVARVIWPADGSWGVDPGTHWVEAGGKRLAYTPPAPGPATYTLVAADEPLRAPFGAIATPEDVVRGRRSGVVLNSVTIDWGDP